MAQDLAASVLNEQSESIGDNDVSGAGSNHQSQEWPHNCSYFVSELMNADRALTLLRHDADFHPPDSTTIDCVTAVDITSISSCSGLLFSVDSDFDEKLRMADLQNGDARVIFAGQKRLYPKDRTFNGYGMKLPTWLRILSSCEIPPDALELLHENNGGWGVHTSYCSDVTGMSCPVKSLDSQSGASPCAYHIWLKPRPWWNEEHFLYARLDLHSDKKLLLVTGTALRKQIECLSSQFNSGVQPHLFSIILALTTAWAKYLEYFVWEQDFATQRLESDTGWSTLGHTHLKPLPSEKLVLRKSMVVTKEGLGHALYASESLCKLFDFLSEQIYSLLPMEPSTNIRLSQLKDAFLQNSSRQWHLKSQVHALTARVDSQWNVVNALIAQHSNHLNYQIATDSRIDTIVMRRISFVTMAFLPATFLATFFSMSFFQVTSNDMTVSPMIWIYVVCAIPLTFILSWQSNTKGSSQLQWVVAKVTKLREMGAEIFERTFHKYREK